METKNYRELAKEMKADIIKEVTALLERDTRHKFSDPFYIHYVEGEVATTEVCHAIEKWSDGTIALCVSKDPNTSRNDEEVMTSLNQLFCYDINSFVDILENLKKDLSLKKKFIITAKETYMRTYEVTADNLEQAIQKVNVEMEAIPYFDKDDSTGIEVFQCDNENNMICPLKRLY